MVVMCKYYYYYYSYYGHQRPPGDLRQLRTNTSEHNYKQLRLHISNGHNTKTQLTQYKVTFDNISIGNGAVEVYSEKSLAGLYDRGIAEFGDQAEFKIIVRHDTFVWMFKYDTVSTNNDPNLMEVFC